MTNSPKLHYPRTKQEEWAWACTWRCVPILTPSHIYRGCKEGSFRRVAAARHPEPTLETRHETACRRGKVVAPWASRSSMMSVNCPVAPTDLPLLWWAATCPLILDPHARTSGTSVWYWMWALWSTKFCAECEHFDPLNSALWLFDNFLLGS